MTDEQIRFLCLNDELRNANLLITDGFGALQEIGPGNDFYHLPHQLMASGLERLMKCFISVVYHGQHGVFPDMPFMKNLGHNLEDLAKEIWQNYYSGRNRPFVDTEYNILTSDQHLRDAISVLSHFGKFGRYYNLDVVAGSRYDPTDPKTEWEALESRVEPPESYASDMERLYREYYPRVHSELIGRLERFVRAIALQFTIGDHVDPKGFIRQASVTFSNFLNLRDKVLGQNDYRRSVKILQKQMEKNETWVKRPESEILADDSLTRIVDRNDFKGDWPFRANRVILERIDSIFLVVNIDGYAYSLTGAAASRFKLPFPHDAGIAILGKSVGPFIEMANELHN